MAINGLKSKKIKIEEPTIITGKVGDRLRPTAICL